ncbi:transcriptional regulator, LysR family [Pseudoxanthomonas sp. GM95]|uniref:LysR family transcriptional regulator n=1 Tax=Pseudoxanthomonas sp. GM95 TaxID=1881043 RepID=UPI0008CEF0BD|nr:LysR family transcriptional regulator [Pseudoxanthomonas sp. GM95]SEL67360.1 transcriptional regulator, LysR family [Pseudoxanthomonas sp. GM95]
MDDIDLIALLPDMAAFVHVVEAGNFSAAARRLGVTPSAVSRQVQRLEQALSVRLIERSTRRLRVTEAGEAVCARCREMTQAASGAFEAAGQLQATPRGLVRLSAPVAYARHLIHPHVPAFLALYPQVDLQLLLLDRLVDPIAEGVDLVLRVTDQPFEGWAARPLHPVGHVLCASPGYLQAHGTPLHPRELATHQCLHLGESREDQRWKFLRGSERAQVSVRGRYAANHSAVRADAAAQGLGIASLPDFVARPWLDEGRLQSVLDDWRFQPPAYAGTAWLLYPPNRYLPPKARVLVDFLVERLAVS